MTVHTRPIDLSSEYQQITDGIVGEFVQVKSGVLEYVSADAIPRTETEGHTLGPGEGYNFTAPTQIWGRKAHGSKASRILVTPI